MDDQFAMLSDLMARLSYKPGYEFKLRRETDDRVTLSLSCLELPDAESGEKSVGLTISNTVPLSTIGSPLDAMHAFAAVVARFELHEAAEFFKLDAQTLFLPHGWAEDTSGMMHGNFNWLDFMNLGGRYLRALKTSILHDADTPAR